MCAFKINSLVKGLICKKSWSPLGECPPIHQILKCLLLYSFSKTHLQVRRYLSRWSKQTFWDDYYRIYLNKCCVYYDSVRLKLLFVLIKFFLSPGYWGLPKIRLREKQDREPKWSPEGECLVHSNAFLQPPFSTSKILTQSRYEA